MIGQLREPQIVEYLHSKASRQRIPLSGTFEVTPRCNLNCKMCYVRLSQEEQEQAGIMLTKESWIRIAEEAKEAGMLFLLLTGGEPFFRQDFRELYLTLHKMGFSININSNGTLIDENTVAWLKQNPPAKINISVYGASNETYERLCGMKNGFDRVKKAICLLKEAGILVKLNCSVTPDNKHDLKKVIEFAAEEDLVLQVATYMFPAYRKDERNMGVNERMDPAETVRQSIWGRIWQRGEAGFDEYVDQVRNGESMIDESEICESGDASWCRAGRSSFWITWDGKLLPCGMMPEPYERLENSGFQTAWEKIVVQVDEIRLPVKCAKCSKKKSCGTCVAMVLAETGGFEEAPKYRCEMMEQYLEQCIEIQKEIKVDMCE